MWMPGLYEMIYSLLGCQFTDTLVNSEANRNFEKKFLFLRKAILDKF